MIYCSLTTALRGIVLALRICSNLKIQITVFFFEKVWTSRPVVEEKLPINLTFGLALQQIVDLVSFVNTIETSHSTNDLSPSYVIPGRKEPNIDNQRLAESRKSHHVIQKRTQV